MFEENVYSEEEEENSTNEKETSDSEYEDTEIPNDEPEDVEEEEEKEEIDDDENMENGQIDPSEFYDEEPKNIKNCKQNISFQVSKLKRNKKRKDIDYERMYLDTYRENAVKLFNKLTNMENSKLLEKKIFKLVNGDKRQHVNLVRLSYSIMKHTGMKCKDFYANHFKNAVYRNSEWIIPERWKEEIFRENQITNNIENPPLPKSGVIKCSRCLRDEKQKDNPARGSRTESFQKQTRSSDEPMTTFCHCLDCGFRWKF